MTVVPNAPGRRPAAGGRHRHRAERSELVYMGSFMPYKNVDDARARRCALLPG